MPPQRIVDSHFHLFDLDHAFYPWLSPRPLPRGMTGDVTPRTTSRTRGFSASERDLLFAATAEKFYRI